MEHISLWNTWKGTDSSATSKSFGGFGGLVSALHALKSRTFDQDIPATELGGHFIELGSQVALAELWRLGCCKETRA